MVKRSNRGRKLVGGEVCQGSMHNGKCVDQLTPINPLSPQLQEQKDKLVHVTQVERPAPVEQVEPKRMVELKSTPQVERPAVPVEQVPQQMVPLKPTGIDLKVGGKRRQASKKNSKMGLSFKGLSKAPSWHRGCSL